MQASSDQQRNVVEIYPSRHLSALTIGTLEKADVKALLENMSQILKLRGGKSLSANQIGVNFPALVFSWDDTVQEMIEPVVVETRGPSMWHLEGCLSTPGLRFQVERNQEITVDYKDSDGFFGTRDFKGELAVAIQHAVDHLNGVTIVDSLSDEEKKEVAKTLRVENVSSSSSCNPSTVSSNSSTFFSS